MVAYFRRTIMYLEISNPMIIMWRYTLDYQRRMKAKVHHRV